MPNFTIQISKQLHQFLKTHPKIKWEKIAIHAIEEKARYLARRDLAWRNSAAKHALENWDDAKDLFVFPTEK